MNSENANWAMCNSNYFSKAKAPLIKMRKVFVKGKVNLSFKVRGFNAKREGNNGEKLMSLHAHQLSFSPTRLI